MFQQEYSQSSPSNEFFKSVFGYYPKQEEHIPQDAIDLLAEMQEELEEEAP